MAPTPKTDSEKEQRMRRINQEAMRSEENVSRTSLSTHIARSFVISCSETDNITRYNIVEDYSVRLPPPPIDEVPKGGPLQASLDQELQGKTLFDPVKEKGTVCVQRISSPSEEPSEETKKAASAVRFPLITIKYPDVNMQYILTGNDGLMQWFFGPLSPDGNIIEIEPAADVPLGMPVGSIRDTTGFFPQELAELHWKTTSIHRRMERVMFSHPDNKYCQEGNPNCQGHYAVKMLLVLDKNELDQTNGKNTRYTRHVICANKMVWEIFESMTGRQPNDETYLTQVKWRPDSKKTWLVGGYSYGESKKRKDLNIFRAWNSTADEADLKLGDKVKELCLVPLESREKYDELRVSLATPKTVVRSLLD